MKRNDSRTAEQLRQHYEVERELAARLRGATRDERRGLYRSSYDELFRRVPSHSLLSKKADSDVSALYARELKLLDRFLSSGTVFLEVGAGDCRLALEIAKRVERVYAVDVSAEIASGFVPPPNFELVLSDGCALDVPEGSVDLILSNQLIEHLHVEDVASHLAECHRVLRAGGRYLCLTPHRFSGPHDISKYFDDVATGFHLHEYTAAELTEAFLGAGFRRVVPVAEAKGHSTTLPLSLVVAGETLLATIPPRTRRRLCQKKGFSILFERLIVLAEK